LSHVGQSILFVPLAFALNIIIGAAVIFAGSRVNPDTRNVDLDQDIKIG
jgi:hypothetical protein